MHKKIKMMFNKLKLSIMETKTNINLWRKDYIYNIYTPGDYNPDTEGFTHLANSYIRFILGDTSEYLTQFRPGYIQKFKDWVPVSVISNPLPSEYCLMTLIFENLGKDNIDGDYLNTLKDLAAHLSDLDEGTILCPTTASIIQGTPNIITIQITCG